MEFMFLEIFRALLVCKAMFAGSWPQSFGSRVVAAAVIPCESRFKLEEAEGM